MWDYIDLYAILQDVTYKSAITILLSGAGLWVDNEPAEAPLPIVRPKPSVKYPKQDSYLLYVATDKGVERSELLNVRTSNGWMPKGKDSYGLGGVKQKTAYEISACLVGSEMCIRDSVATDKGVERSELLNVRTSNGWMPKGKDSYGLGGVKPVSYTHLTLPTTPYV